MLQVDIKPEKYTDYFILLKVINGMYTYKRGYSPHTHTPPFPHTHTHTEEGRKYPGIRKTIRWSGSSIQAALSTFASGEVDCCQMLCNILHIIEDNHEDLP